MKNTEQTTQEVKITEQPQDAQSRQKGNDKKFIASEEFKKLSATMPEFPKNVNHVSFKTATKPFRSYFSKTSYKIRQKTKSRSRSPVNYNVEPTFRRTNGIPSKLTDRLNFLSEIFKNEKFINYFKQAPNRTTSSIDQITRYITKYSGTKGEIETFAMIFYYICNTITYDTKGLENHRDNNYDQRADNVLRTGLALNEGFNKLFEYMCNKKHLKIKVLHGNCKYLPLDRKKGNTNHVWSAINYKGEWYFCDLLMGSGGIVEKNTLEETYFNPYFFITPPEYMIITHRPDDDEWQLNAKTITEKQYYKKKFLDVGAFYQKVYENNIQLLTHDFPCVTISKPSIAIKILVLNTVIQTDLYTGNGKEKIQEIKYSIDEDSNEITIETNFPSNGEYIIRILGRPTTSTDLIYSKYLDYKIRICDESSFRFNRFKIAKPKIRKPSASISITTIPQKFDFPHTKIITDYTKIFPTKTNRKICFDNDGAYIFEPRSMMIKKGNEVKFKVRVKGALVVAVLDGKKWTYLKRKDESVYEGQTVIQTDNVSICSLKACNVYTEVFRFKVYKDRAQLA